VPPQVAPPNIQPGQVYGHNALRQTHTIQPSAPPLTPPAYPITESPSSLGANGHPPSHSSFAPSPHISYPPTVPTQHAYPPPQNYATLHKTLPPISHNAPPPPMPNHLPNHEYAHHPPPPPPVPDHLPPHEHVHPFTSQFNHPAPLAPHNSLTAPLNTQHNLPAPVTSQHVPAAPVTSQNRPLIQTPQRRPASPTSQRSQAGGPPTPATHGYPSPPSVRSTYRPPAPQTAYPPAPSLVGSDTASLRSDDVTQNRRPTSRPSRVGSHAAFFEEQANRQATTRGDKPIYKGEQQAKNVNRLSQYDNQFPIGENRPLADTSSISYHDLSNSDTQSLKKSNETYNPWEANTLEATRKESLGAQERNSANGDLYPNLRTPSGIAKH
jgi:hypothetical protein